MSDKTPKLMVGDPNNSPTFIPFPEIEKISLSPGDVLMVKVYSEDISDASFSELNRYLERLFPNNKAMIVQLKPNQDISFTAIQDNTEPVCGPKTCADCNCGKKEG